MILCFVRCRYPVHPSSCLLTKESGNPTLLVPVQFMKRRTISASGWDMRRILCSGNSKTCISSCRKRRRRKRKEIAENGILCFWICCKWKWHLKHQCHALSSSWKESPSMGSSASLDQEHWWTSSGSPLFHCPSPCRVCFLYIQTILVCVLCHFKSMPFSPLYLSSGHNGPAFHHHLKLDRAL